MWKVKCYMANKLIYIQSKHSSERIQLKIKLSERQRFKVRTWMRQSSMRRGWYSEPCTSRCSSSLRTAGMHLDPVQPQSYWDAPGSCVVSELLECTWVLCSCWNAPGSCTVPELLECSTFQIPQTQIPSAGPATCSSKDGALPLAKCFRLFWRQDLSSVDCMAARLKAEVQQQSKW